MRALVVSKLVDTLSKHSVKTQDLLLIFLYKVKDFSNVCLLSLNSEQTYQEVVDGRFGDGPRSPLLLVDQISVQVVGLGQLQSFAILLSV